MAYNRLVGPAIEPLTVADAKRQLNVDQDFTDDDLVITRITVAARQYAETRTRSTPPGAGKTPPSRPTWRRPANPDGVLGRLPAGQEPLLTSQLTRAQIYAANSG